ncbi:MAG: right-handed parallel beta-helix repeat-containing protein [Bacteroidota bacterium]
MRWKLVPFMIIIRLSVGNFGFSQNAIGPEVGTFNIDNVLKGSFDNLLESVGKPFPCYKCDHIISSQHHQDGEKLNFQPGDTICLDASIAYKNLKFTNIRGTEENPITMINCGGTVIINTPSGYTFVLKTENSSHFRISGTGSPKEFYGIKLRNAKVLGLTLDKLSTNFEIDHLEISDVGFSGITAKTDPGCNNGTTRGHFTMKNVSFHDNFVHDVGGEGFYVGNSFYANGKQKDCGTVFPHAIESLSLYNNIIDNTGRESIQVGSATKDAKIYSNRMSNYGLINKKHHTNGIQIGEGTGGLCYNNVVFGGPGNGIVVLGYGDNVVFNNLIIEPQENGIFCDERYTPKIEGNGFSFFNNTIINPGENGIKLYAELVDMNRFVNNVVINPGSFERYENDKNKKRTGKDSFIFLLNETVNVIVEGNYFSREIHEAGFISPSTNNFRLKRNSPLIDQGVDLGEFEINFDILEENRPQGEKPDIGAFEFVK